MLPIRHSLVAPGRTPRRPSRRFPAGWTALALAVALSACDSSTEPRALDAEARTGADVVESGAQASGTTSAEACDGTLGSITVEEVDVPSGATCILDGTRVEGNVLVRGEATLEARGARIDGDVQAEDAEEVRTSSGTFVGGNIQVKRRATARISDTSIDGDLQLEEAGASLIARSVIVGGNLQFKKAEGADIAGSFVEGDIQLEENRGHLSAEGTDVGGNFQIVKNRGGVRLVDNRVEESLQCDENRPAPVGSGNEAGEKEDQCRGL